MISLARLKSFARVIAGQSPPSDHVRDLADGLPFIQGNAEFGERTPSPVWECDQAPKIALPGDVLLSVRAPVGALNVASDRVGIGRGVAAVRANDERYQAWLYWALEGARDDLISRATGSTFGAVSASDIAELRFLLPEHPEQVADYLDHETAEIDAFISDLLQLYQLELDRVRTFQERIIVTEAESIAIRRLSPVRTSGVSVNATQDSAQPGQVGVLRTSAVSRGFFRPDENKAVVEPGEIERLAAPVIADRVLINRANTPSLVGSAAYADVDYEHLYLSDKIWSLDFAAENEYVWRGLQTRYYRDQVELLAVGASTSMQNLGYEDFLSVRLPVPGMSDQRRIVTQLRATWGAVESSLADIDAAVALAKERRAALITAAVTGQVDVATAHQRVVDSIQSGLQEAQ